MALTRQCELAGVPRSTIYAPILAAKPDEQKLGLLAEIDTGYTRHPFYGSRKMTVYLRGMGHPINRKRVQRLMGKLGLAGMAPGPNTSRPQPQHKVYPYLLRGAVVAQPNQVWSTDITQVRLARGFVYLVAVINWYSRKVLTWRVSNTLDSEFCVDCLEQALQTYSAPEIFNTDQGCQFTSEAFTGVLKTHDIAERTHQSLGYSTPDDVYRTASGGGASIVDKFSEREKSRSETKPGQRRSAACDRLPS